MNEKEIKKELKKIDITDVLGLGGMVAVTVAHAMGKLTKTEALLAAIAFEIPLFCAKK